MLENLREYYQYNRDILMESSTVIFWAELHWKHIYVRRAYMRWLGERYRRLGELSLGHWHNVKQAQAWNKRPLTMTMSPMVIVPWATPSAASNIIPATSSQGSGLAFSWVGVGAQLGLGLGLGLGFVV